MRDNDRTPAQLYALIFGVVLLLVGIVGLFVNSSFSTGNPPDSDKLLGLFAVDGWHNLVHIASGIAGIALSRTVTSARAFAIGFGIVYGLVTIYGFIDGNDVIRLIPVNTADNWLHLAIAAAGLVAGFMTHPARDRDVAVAR